MLWMKGWLETRWRLTFWFGFPFVLMGVSYFNRNAPQGNAMGALGLGLVLGWICLAGAGVKSQSPIGFPEGLAGSTQFTISLPVSRLRLLAVRSGIGLSEGVAATVLIGYLSWSLFPATRGRATFADLAEFLLASLVFLSGPYFASAFFTTFLEEPISLMCAGWTILGLWWLSFRVPPAVDIFRIWGQASPLLTHRLPWSQMAVAVCLASVFFFAAFRVIQMREY
jgi:hypothetical protein